MTAATTDTHSELTIATAVEPLISLAEQGLGLACTPDFMVRAQFADGSLAVSHRARAFQKFARARL